MSRKKSSRLQEQEILSAACVIFSLQRIIISGTRKKSDRISEKECSLSIFVTVPSEAIENV